MINFIGRRDEVVNVAVVSRGGREEVTVVRPCEGECVDRGGVKTDFDRLHRV